MSKCASRTEVHHTGKRRGNSKDRGMYYQQGDTDVTNVSNEGCDTKPTYMSKGAFRTKQ